MDERKHCDLDVTSEIYLPSSTSVNRVMCHKFNNRLPRNCTCITGLCTMLIIHVWACFLKSFHNKDHRQQGLITLVWARWTFLLSLHNKNNLIMQNLQNSICVCRMGWWGQLYPASFAICLLIMKRNLIVCCNCYVFEMVWNNASKVSK